MLRARGSQWQEFNFSHLVSKATTASLYEEARVFTRSPYQHSFRPKMNRYSHSRGMVHACVFVVVFVIFTLTYRVEQVYKNKKHQHTHTYAVKFHKQIRRLK